jgi:hypothetical protein
VISVRWCLIRNDELNSSAVVAEESLASHEIRGWARISGWADDPHLPPGQFPPLEAAEPAADPEPAPERKPAKTTSKENT